MNSCCVYASRLVHARAQARDSIGGRTPKCNQADPAFRYSRLFPALSLTAVTAASFLQDPRGLYVQAIATCSVTRPVEGFGLAARRLSSSDLFLVEIAGDVVRLFNQCPHLPSTVCIRSGCVSSFFSLSIFAAVCRQEDAPTDVSGLFFEIYNRINEDLDDVLKLDINYVGGVIHRYAWRGFILICVAPYGYPRR